MALSGHKVNFEFPETDAQLGIQLCQDPRWEGLDAGVTQSPTQKKTEGFQGLSVHDHNSFSVTALSQSSGGPRPALTLRKEIACIEGTPKLCAAQSILEASELGSLHIHEQFSECPITYLFAYLATSPSRKEVWWTAELATNTSPTTKKWHLILHP